MLSKERNLLITELRDIESDASILADALEYGNALYEEDLFRLEGIKFTIDRLYYNVVQEGYGVEDSTKSVFDGEGG